MQLADLIYEVSKQLSAPALGELLDFAEFLQQRKVVATESQTTPIADDYNSKGQVTRTLALLASSRLAQRPKADGDEVARRIASLRNDLDISA